MSYFNEWQRAAPIRFAAFIHTSLQESENEFLCANSVMLCVFVVKLPGKTFTTEARSLH